MDAGFLVDDDDREGRVIVVRGRTVETFRSGDIMDRRSKRDPDDVRIVVLLFPTRSRSDMPQLESLAVSDDPS